MLTGPEQIEGEAQESNVGEVSAIPANSAIDSFVSNIVSTDRPTTNPIVQEDKSSDLMLVLEDDVITSDETEITEEKTVQANAFLTTYNRHPSCVQLNINTSYTLTNTVSGNNYCYYFPVPSSSSVKIEAFLNSQQVGENHNLTLAQDDPANPYTFPSSATSSSSGNSDERALMV